MLTIDFLITPPFGSQDTIIKKIFTKIALGHNKEIGVLTLVVGDDEWLLDYNNKFLNHNYYTDIITFDYSENNLLSADFLISLDRVIDNAIRLNVSRETEFLRVCIHGFLHLCGYSDKTEKEQKIMREKEDYYLSLS